MTTSQPTPRYSALQLAWLQELGIEKPWLPNEQPAKQMASEKASAPIEAIARPPRIIVPRGVAAASPQTSEMQVDTRALAAGASDMQVLAEMVSGCQACGLCRERQQAVTGEGVMQPAIMVIGEAPGDYEDRQGRPFVDRPGLLLDNMLSAIQSSRDKNVYISHIVKCRPPGNRNPKPAELAACKPYLLRQIEMVRPFSILAVGRAANALLETDEPVDTLRQVTHSLVMGGQKIPLIVTSHPVTLLSHPNEKAAAWRDLMLAKTVSGL